MLSKRLRIILNIICLIGVILSAFYLCIIGYNYYKASKSYDSITEKVVANNSHAPKAEDEKIDNKYLDIDFKQLKSENEDIIAWIDIPNTKISYPVLYGKDNDFYLHRDYRKADSVSGSIFVDARYDDPFSGQNTVIYGHNMKDGSMFRSLQDYVNKDLYKKAPLIHIYLADGRIQIYKIVSAHVISDVASAYSNKVTDEFLEELIENNNVPSPDSTSINDHFITLSTCTNSGSDYPYRTVIQAKLEQILDK